MMIYTGNADGESLDMVESLGLGIMVASSATWEPRKSYKRVPCAMDNGAFQCWRRGFPFMEDVFLKTIDIAYNVGLSMEFITCPDIVAGGKRSLDFSMEWATGRLKTTPRLALVVQDGMTTGHVSNMSPELHFSHIFIGGSVEWKWKTAQEWIDYAHGKEMKCHIGQCGTLDRLRAARRMGADSVDSTSIVRNQSWHIIDEYNGCRQSDLFLESTNKEDEG
tara:strand:+ start:1168 stop:1830 length:663 start_codon:yes stop_codon:yes gene_type:complete